MPDLGVLGNTHDSNSQAFKRRKIAACGLPITQAGLWAAFLFSSLFTLVVMLALSLVL